MIEVNAEAFQRIEHAERILTSKLSMNIQQQHELQKEEGRIRCELQRLENDKYRTLTH